MKKLLKLPEVRERTRKSTTRVYMDMEAGRFPRPIRIGPRAVAWLEDEIDEWLAERIAERDADEAA